MDLSEFRDRLAAGTLTRRDLARAMAAAGVGFAMMPVGPRAARADAGDITYFTWASYEVPGLHPKYIEKHGGSPTSTFFADGNEALQKMRAGYRPDLAHPCNADVPRWRDAGVIQPVDTGRLANWPDVWDKLKDIPGTQENGQQWFVPTDWGNASVIYRTDLVEVEEESWSLLYDERYKGRIASWDDGPTNVMIAAWVLGYENDTTLNEEQLVEVKKLLEKQRDVQRYYWSSRQDFDQALAGGEVVLGYSWNSTVVAMAKQGIPVRFMNPKEGISTYCCGLVLCADPPGPLDLAYDFIDAWLDPSAGKYLIEDYGYGHSNRRSFELVAPERLAELGISTPEAMFAQGRFDKTVPAEFQTRYEELWQDVQAGL